MSTHFPGVHSVQFYKRDGELIECVSAMLAASISFGDAALVVATPEHRQMFARELQSLGIEVSRLAEEGSYIALDASQVSLSVMRNGLPDRDLFDANFGGVLTEARRHARNRNRGLTIYGECVALLWQDGKKEAALTLERFWHDVFREDRSLHLHCAYPTSVFVNEMEKRQVQALHSQILQHDCLSPGSAA